MIKFKKDLNYKIISVMVAVLFLFNNFLYAAPFRIGALRLPMNNYKRVEKTLSSNEMTKDSKGEFNDIEDKEWLTIIFPI